MTLTASDLRLENEFSVLGIDLATFDYPKVRVVQWNSISLDGGHFSIEAAADSVNERVRLHKVEFRKSGHKSAQAAYREMLAAAREFNRDPRTHWLRILRSAADYVETHHTKRIAEMTTANEMLEAFLAETKGAIA